LIAFFLFFCIELSAQEVGTHNVVPSKTNSKGRREFHKEKRIKRHERRLEKYNERKFEENSDK
jgi:hypothetical protein